MVITRRNFLKGCATYGFAANLASINALAASNENEYKALVCVFLLGGMDGHDTLIPFDTESFNSYANLRGSLLNAYDSNGTSRRPDNLLALTGSLEGRRFGFPQEFAEMHQLYESGQLAVVGNVGPLVAPITRENFSNGNNSLVPPRLFSHNDQQSIWMASQPEGARSGWGGRFADRVQSSNALSAFTTISTAGSSIFLTGENVRSFQISTSGTLTVDNLSSNNVGGSDVFSSVYEQVLRDSGIQRTNLFESDYANAVLNSLNNNALVEEQFDLPGDPTTEFPNTDLGAQLNTAARMIARRSGFGANRQIFFITARGFDTHSQQADSLPNLQRNISQSISAFYNAMVELGVQNQVTTFTASDFGRTLTVNGDGTDHGWGGHHIVVGGAVNGQQILGDVPTADLGHAQDAGRGRLIPQVAVDQYAGELGRWFGLSDSDLALALPGFSNFDATTLSHLFV